MKLIVELTRLPEHEANGAQWETPVAGKRQLHVESSKPYVYWKIWKMLNSFLLF